MKTRMRMRMSNYKIICTYSGSQFQVHGSRLESSEVQSKLHVALDEDHILPKEFNREQWNREPDNLI
jgi:hypothetical protein